MTASDPVIGVLALQGDVREHLVALAGLGVTARPIRRATELDDVDGIVIPGGESTTICRLLDVFELREPLTRRLRDGLPAFGSCAGMIVLADQILDGRADQRPLGAIDITVRRNAFGRQVDSFEADLDVAGLSAGAVRGVFIRAPWVERAGPDVTVLARVGEHPVAVRQGKVLATSFHPEVSGDDRLHALFLDIVQS
ncbi:MAG: pyridoxal 5'-phosphate synthase glutaminase subunit PdxT [Nakamurella sp.]